MKSLKKRGPHVLDDLMTSYFSLQFALSHFAFRRLPNSSSIDIKFSEAWRQVSQNTVQLGHYSVNFSPFNDLTDLCGFLVLGIFTARC